MKRRAKRFLLDERGAEVSELAIVLSILVAGCVALILLIGPKIASYYMGINNGLGP